MSYIGGIDLGGTKIEAALFDDNLQCLQKQRVATPSSYQETLDALVRQIDWIREMADGPVPVGLGSPGFHNEQDGLVYASNLMVNRKPFKSDIIAMTERLCIGQDLECFALSEANGGAGHDTKYFVGMVLGTGLGSAFCVDGKLVSGRQGIIGEIGHVPVSASATNRLGLPDVTCGCGQRNCLETWAAGPGLMRLAGHFGSTWALPSEIVAAEKNGDVLAGQIMEAWLEIVCEALLVIQLSFDPDCVVLGGGLSRIDGIVERLSNRFSLRCLPGSNPPEIKKARFGDSSGTRGAALLAKCMRDTE